MFISIFAKNNGKHYCDATTFCNAKHVVIVWLLSVVISISGRTYLSSYNYECLPTNRSFCAFINNCNNFNFTITGSEFDLNSESKASVPTTTSYLQLLQLSEDDTSVANPSLSQNKTKVYISSTELIVETL